MPFTWKYNVSGGRPLVQTLLAKDTETFTIGDMVNLESGEADLAATSDTDILGGFVGPEDPADQKANEPGVVEATDSTTVLKVITNPDAVYAVADANARLMGATLDISGATGAQTVAASSNTEFVVVARKRQNADDTLVSIIGTLHPFTKSQ